MNQFPFKTKLLEVSQPMGTFFIAVIPAEVLLNVAYSDALSASPNNSGGYDLTGTQRRYDPARMQPIADFINRVDSVFPNSIILAANFRDDTGLVEEGDEFRWRVTHQDENLFLEIPSEKKLAAIIDGQHRLFAFAKANQSRQEMPLVCSIFMDLPKPYQAQIFATINSNQKPVNKSLTYELFGYNLEEEDPIYWSPDKLAVYLTRRLYVDSESPLQHRIIIAPIEKDPVTIYQGLKWKVSTAVVVDGILGLITTNPKKDTSDLLNEKKKTRADLKGLRGDRSSFREEYLNTNDIVIYRLVLNYLKACNKLFWENAPESSFITKSVGIRALFAVLKVLSAEAKEKKDISEGYFFNKLHGACNIDFSADVYRNSSAQGVALIKNAILDKLTH